MPNDTCIWPKCYNRPWASRGLPICGPHAETVAAVMRPEQKSRLELDIQIQTLRGIIAEQSRTIGNLRGGDVPEPVRTQAPVDGTVYYVRVGPHIKIGWASKLDKRMKSYPPDSQLLATEPGTRKDEQHRHRMFAAHRTHGREWYAMVPSLIHHIDQIKAQHGEPDAVDFAAKPVQVPQPRPRQYVGGNYRGLGNVGETRWP